MCDMVFPMPPTSRIPAVKKSPNQRRSARARRMTSPLHLVEQIREGIPSTAYTALAQRLGLTKTELATTLRIAPRTILDRRRKKLSPPESEKMVRVEQILDEAEKVFGSANEAKTWIISPQRGLGFHKPLEMLDTDVGAGHVRDFLSAIKYGNVW
jgi:putative toxin-antitoxin system antitoxin component (TIGR02293 family)